MDYLRHPLDYGLCILNPFDYRYLYGILLYIDNLFFYPLDYRYAYCTLLYNDKYVFIVLLTKDNVLSIPYIHLSRDSSLPIFPRHGILKVKVDILISW